MNSIFKPIDLIHGDEHLAPDQTMEEVQERIHAFWNPQDRKEAVSFLAVELADDIETADLFFDLCANDIDDHEKILEAARKIVIRAQGAIYEYAQNDRLPLTGFDDRLPF